MNDRILTALSALLLVACSDTPDSPQKVVADGVGGPADSSGVASSNGSGTATSSGTSSSTGTASGTSDPIGSNTGTAATTTTTSTAGTSTTGDDGAGDNGAGDDSAGPAPTSDNGAGLGGTDDGAADDSASGSGADDGAIDDTGADDASIDDMAADDTTLDDAAADDESTDDMGGGPGGSTCTFGVQTGSACNPAADTEPCAQGPNSCDCGADATWTCGPNSGGPGGDDDGADDGTTDDATADDTASDDGSTDDGNGGSVEIDCDAQMPSVATEQHSATWAEGGSGNLAWQIWTNGGPGNLTTFAGEPSFIASWNNSGDYLGRMGFEWGNNGRPYTEYGTIKADYVWNKSGTAGQYSYIGIYGWSTNPCVEWYIVEDSFHQMPFNTGDQPIGTAEVDGGTYNLVYRNTTGTGGDRCGGAANWDQFYSIRLEGKRCGTITVSDHFDVWAQQGWNLGNLLEVKVVVEAAAGTGSVEFPLANVTTSQ